MDGFSNGPHVPGGPGVPGPYPQYPPASEYASHMQQRPPSQSTPGKSKGTPTCKERLAKMCFQAPSSSMYLLSFFLTLHL